MNFVNPKDFTVQEGYCKYESLNISDADRGYLIDELKRRVAYFIDSETEEVLEEAEVTVSVAEAIRLVAYLEHHWETSVVDNPWSYYNAN